MMRRLFVLLALFAVVPPADAAPVRKPAAKRQAVARDWTRTVVQTPQGGVRMGNPAARVAVIEYGSRTCPHCARFAAEGLPALKAGYVARGRVSYEFRDHPIHGALDLGPILLGRCGGTARFFPLLDAMFADQNILLSAIDRVQAKVAALPEDRTGRTAAIGFADGLGYTAFVAARGVPAVRARACLADVKAIDAIVARAGEAERDWHVESTPTFIVNGKAVQAADWATLEPLLRAAGA